MLRSANRTTRLLQQALMAMLIASAPAAEAGAPFTPVGDMSTARALHDAALLPDGRVLVVGGIADFGIILGSAELYDPASRTFALTTAPNEARSRPTVVSLADGRVLVFGGRGGEDGGTYLTSAEVYDPATGRFDATGDTTVARYVASAVLLEDGRVLVAGGFTRSDGALASAELYDPATGQFTATGSMSVPRIQPTAAVRLDDGRVFIAGGGNDDGPLASTELYDPSSGTFTPTGDLPEPRDAHSAVLLHDGRVLIVGGSDNGAGGGFPVYQPAAALYDPVSGLVTPTGSLAHPRDMQTATVLSDGRVLVAGGSHVVGNPGTVTVAAAEIYDPAAGTFDTVGDLAVPRDEPVAIALADRDVLLIGGWAFAGDTVGDLPTPTAEVFAMPAADVVFQDGFDGT